MSEKTPPTTRVAVWIRQIRGPFLLLSVFLVLIGGAVAHYDGVFCGSRVLLAMLGVLLAHVAVNLFNEYADHRAGIDQHTQRTPFSGGSGTLQEGLTSPGVVLAVAWAVLLAALAIGLYLAWVSSWHLILFIVAGGLASVFYTTHLTRWMLGELAAGACLGTFVILGTYYCQAGHLTPAVIWVSIPPGILTALLLLLNEFPDVEADRAGGRRHLVIVLGRKRAAACYVVSLVVVYLLLVCGALVRLLPPTVLFALLTAPLGYKASTSALRHSDRVQELIPGLGANVGLVLGTDLLIAIAYFVRL